MDSKKNRLMEVTARETSEFEKMAVILNKKHEALSKLDTTTIQSLVVEELTELKTINAVEKERAGILKELSLSGADLNDCQALEKKLGKEGSETYNKLHSNFKRAFTKVLSLNGISRAMLKHSLAFIRHNIHILTDGGNRRLVDRKA